MNSFYGGRQGRSFIISKTYESIESMVEDFGNKDCQVNFDEYVLINTKNKNLPEHGNVYKKGYDFNGEIEAYHKTVYGEDNPYATVRIASNGAEYVGNIAGPAGHAPILRLDSYEEVMNKAQFMKEVTFSFLGFDINTDGEPDKTAVIEAIIKKQEDLELESGKDFYVLKVSEGEGEENITHYYCYSENGDAGWYYVDEEPSEKNIGSFSPKSDSIIPAVRYIYEEDGTIKYQKNEDGYYYAVKEEDSYNDEIKWVYCNLRDENLQDTIAYIGFQFVAPLFDFQADFVDTDYDQPLVIRNQTQEEIEAHPFYSSWLLKIPKGVKGGQIENLRLIDFDPNWPNGNEPQDIIFYEDGSFEVSSYSKMDEHRHKYYNNEYFQLVVYDFVDYTYLKTGQKYTIYLNEYVTAKDILDIRINEEGKFQFLYQNTNGYLEWYTIGGDFPVNLIETLRYDEETGNLYASYNIPDENGYKERLVGTIDIITPTSVILNASEETVDAVANANVVVGGSVYIVEEV